MKRTFLIILAALTLFSGCNAAPKRFSAVYTDVFDTVTEFTAYCESEEEFESLSEALHAELLRLHGIFDIYDLAEGINNAKSLNDGVKGDYPPELCELVSFGVSMCELSGGQLNIALGSVLSLWSDCREKGVLPDADELLKRAEHCDIEKINLNGGEPSLEDPEMSLDFGALAKGYAAEKATEFLHGLGAERFALSLGGNISVSGEKPDGKWEIGVQSPDGGILTVLKISDLSVVTSGDYQRYYEVDGVRYHHIIDPKTLYPAKLWRSVTVVSKSSKEADALSTALFCLDLDSGKEMLEKFSAEAVWVSYDGEVVRSKGFESYEK